MVSRPRAPQASYTDQPTLLHFCDRTYPRIRFLRGVTLPRPRGLFPWRPVTVHGSAPETQGERGDTRRAPESSFRREITFARPYLRPRVRDARVRFTIPFPGRNVPRGVLLANDLVSSWTTRQKGSCAECSVYKIDCLLITISANGTLVLEIRREKTRSNQ